MDRQAHDYGAASAMGYGQQQRPTPNMQQQQYGFHPQQQFPPSVQGPPFYPPHPSPQQFPYPSHMQQPHLPPHPQFLHLQQQPPAAFPPHIPSRPVPSFHGMYDSPPPPAPAPSDPELHKRIDKLVEYAAKNGPEFEAMIREKQKDNPDYDFLFGGEGHNYYRYKLWVATHPPGGAFNSPFPPPSVPMMPPPSHMMSPGLPNAPPVNTMSPPSMMGAAPPMHQPPYGPFPGQHPQPFMGHGRTDYDQSNKPFIGLGGPLPSDVAMELNNVLSGLTGAKDSIKSAKAWFMQRAPFAPALAEALRDRVFGLDDSERQLHIIYVVNDILFDSLQWRTNPRDLDNIALAFKPVLASMLARIYHNPQTREENQSRLQKILQFWASKEVYDQSTISVLEAEMTGGQPPQEFTADSVSVPRMPQKTPNWQLEKQSSGLSFTDQNYIDAQQPPIPTMANQQFNPNVPSGSILGSMPINSSVQPVGQQPLSSTGTERPPPYPLFPPGLIPGMVRKMQIGSGVPYTPLSPLDIPTVIPPSDISQSEILARVSKFFKEIGEVNPSEGPLNSDLKDEYEEYERESPVRKGGACIPPPPNLQVDPETGAYADGSTDSKGTGRLGLGATANPNEPSQYDDVYSSYRKQRSSTYHSFMSARAATK